MPNIEIKNLKKVFPLSRAQMRVRKTNENVKVAVDGVSISFASGEVYGLIGPNGAGKTTVLRMIASLIKPTEGQVYCDGKDIYDDISSYRSKIGFLTSELKLDDFFTPAYTFMYMSELYGIEPEQAKRKMDRLFCHFGIDKFSDVKIKELSTGMKQKVSLACSLCHDPEIIIFDEPTNGLDIISSKDVEDFLLELKNQGKTIIVSTHIFSLLEKLCDKVGVIADGKLLREGYVKDLTAHASLEDAFFQIVNKEVR